MSDYLCSLAKLPVLLLFASLAYCGQTALAATSPQQKITVLLGVDGLSEQSFRKSQQMGLFKAFSNSSTHIAPFPTMTDLTWSTLTKTADIFGAAGRIRSVEATYFDESDQSIQGDPRDYYRRLAFPKYYLNAFQFFFNPYVEGLMYFPTKEMAKVEIENVVNAILQSKDTLITGYIGGIDSTAHTQLNRLYPVLQELDRGLNRLLTEFNRRGQLVEIILVSDHGNVGRFQEGSSEQELQPVDIKEVLTKTNFRSVQKLTQQRDVAIPMLALGTWAPVYLKDRTLIDELVTAISKEVWFDLAVQLRQNNATNATLEITGRDKTTARIFYLKDRHVYQYHPITGNPLQLPNQAISTFQKVVDIPESKLLELTLTTPYPDSLKRLVDSVSNRDFDFPDLIITLKDGYYLQNSLSAFTKMYRTHGSLSRASSFGILASTGRSLPAYIRTSDILPTLGITPKLLFGKTAETHNLSNQEAAQTISRNAERGIETNAKDLSGKRIFQIMSRFIGDTRAYFIVSELDTFLRAFNLNPLKAPDKSHLNPNGFKLDQLQVKSLMTSEDIGALTDVVLNNSKAPLEALVADPRISQLKEKIGFKDDSTQPTSLKDRVMESNPEVVEPLRKYTLTSKRSAMKLYQIPFLLEKALAIPERSFLPEKRDIPFAQYWNLHRTNFNNGTYSLDTTRASGTVATSLFKDIFREQILEDKIFPTPLEKLYNNKIKTTTIVYVPGIYNSLFDKEIFHLGLAALKEDLGLRVISPPVESICAADYNGDIILNYLKTDRRQRLERGFPEPSYMILGYSKGTIDVLHAMTKEPAFFSKHVHSLVSIASPLHGSAILDKTDLPFAVVDLLSDNQGPAICHKEKPSGPSISPAAMESFWRKHQRGLIGLTRYFSLTFTSEPENSHLFMRATKLIAQFEEDNDGVVTKTSSHFPLALGATDLGTVEADHLAGILSSKFEQKAFMRAVVNTMAELDIENRETNLRHNAKQILAASQIITGKKQYRLNLQSDRVQIKPSLLTIQGLLHPLQTQATVTNTYELNRLLIPESKDPANDYQTRIKLPSNQLKFDPYKALDVQKMSDLFAAFKVTPSTPETLPNGIQLEFNHRHMVHFRMDHQLNYESRSPLGLDDNQEFGFFPTQLDGEPALLMRSKNNSIRMTTMAYRFKPSDFPNMQLNLTVNKGVKGADPVLGGAGRDDSAFQVWFTIRYGETPNDRSLVETDADEVILFGYYWGDPAPNGEVRQPGQIFENWYSKKNVVIATLPESKQLLLNDQSMLGKNQNYQQNLVADLARAFPGRDVEKMEILAITLQHDSNDSGDSSEAIFKHLRFQRAALQNIEPR